jgi:aspartyl-tRNA(Asn)/glutamyl-tRNA(Gln) amidotransferase subunit B
MNIKIGLEVHVQLTSLKTKLFCSCSADYRGKPPNTNICPVCLGMPGSLPRVNKEAIKSAIKVALAFNSNINQVLAWARKHYFYPDLPKGYQISQYDGKGVATFAKGGYIDIRVNGEKKRIRIRRINIEEDPARIVYPTGDAETSSYILLDYNRSGIALLEIVTEPDMNSPEEVRAFLEKLRSILEHLEVSDLSLEGSMRADVNISVGDGERVEVKNISGFKDIEQAIRYEVARQIDVLQKGGRIERETRHWDSTRKITKPARVKEYEEDYRYMPDPNLPFYIIPDELIEEVRKTLPELPEERAARFINQHGLSEYLAHVLVSSKALADYYEKVTELSGVKGDKVAGLIVTDLLGWIDSEDLSNISKIVPPEDLATVIKLLEKNEITIKMAKEMIPLLVRGEKPRQIIERMGWSVIRNRAVLEKIVDNVLKENPQVLKDIERNPRAVQFIIGKVLEKTGKKGDPKIIAEIVKEKIRLS